MPLDFDFPTHRHHSLTPPTSRRHAHLTRFTPDFHLFPFILLDQCLFTLNFH
jgi:hypothetical protein